MPRATIPEVKESRTPVGISADSKLREIVMYKGGVGKVIDILEKGKEFLVMNQITKELSAVKV